VCPIVKILLLNDLQDKVGRNHMFPIKTIQLGLFVVNINVLLVNKIVHVIRPKPNPRTNKIKILSIKFKIANIGVGKMIHIIEAPPTMDNKVSGIRAGVENLPVSLVLNDGGYVVFEIKV
jgi:hypothetical protein